MYSKACMHSISLSEPSTGLQLERPADEAAVCALVQSTDFQAALASSPNERHALCAALLARVHERMQAEDASGAPLDDVLAACVACAPPPMLAAAHHCRAVAELQQGELERAWEAAQKAMECAMHEAALVEASAAEPAGDGASYQQQEARNASVIDCDKLACLVLQLKIAMQVR